MKYLLLILALFLSMPCTATTYYISYSSGSNANNGLTKGAAWKSHPYMQSAAGCGGALPTYAHSAGDIFIFKQGDSWPKACFDMVIAAGGSNGNPDQYTYDASWGTAGGTTGNAGQAVGVYQFTAGGSAISGTDTRNRFVYDNGNNYVTFNGVEFTGMLASTCPNYGDCFMVQIEASTTNFILSNCYAHGWTHSGAATDPLFVMVGGTSSPFNTNSKLTGCVIDGVNSGGAGVSDSGGTTYSIPLADNNIIRNLTNGLLCSINCIIHDNFIGPINVSFDAGNHENCIEPIQLGSSGTSTNYIYNNVFHDCTAVGLLTQGAAPAAGAEVDYIWNNVAYLGSQGAVTPFKFDSVSTSNTSSAVYAYNNTIYGGASVCMSTTNRGNGNYATLDIRNNHCINTSGGGTAACGAGGNLITLGITGTSCTISNNKIETSAGNYASPPAGSSAPPPYGYAPANSSAGTVGFGVNLNSLATGNLATLANDTTYGDYRGVSTRGGGACTPSAGVQGCWDAGAYMFSEAATAFGTGIGIGSGIAIH